VEDPPYSLRELVLYMLRLGSLGFGKEGKDEVHTWKPDAYTRVPAAA